MSEVASKDRNLASAATSAAAGTPVVIDLGKHRKKRVKELRQGKPGKLLQEVSNAIEALRAQKAIAHDAQTVIVVVREKSKGRLLGF